MIYEYTSIDRIFSKLIRDVTNEFSERDVIEWTAEALEAIGAVKAYEEAVAFIEVKNHQAKLPNGIHNIIQIARDNAWTSSNTDKFCPAEIKKELCTIDSNCAECTSDATLDYIFLDCNGQPLNDYDVAYYRPYFDLQYEYYNWRNSSMYKQNYTPVRLANNTFFNTVVCTTEDTTSQAYTSSRDEYTIIDKKYVRTSFESGFIAVAHNRQKVDPETGYPMIPDTYSNKTAIVKYITLKMLDRQCYNGREAACGKAEKADRDWQWYCGQASAADMMPHGIDDHQDLLDQRSYMLPRQNDYYSFFGKLNTAENRQWTDPNNRNHKARYFSGV